MAISGRAALRRILLEVVGWTLVVAGIAALVLPGPGLLMLFAGLVVLSQQYEWAERRLAPVERVAKRTAAEGVETWLRIVLSALGALAILAVGVLWIISPSAPGWWPVRESWWLVGGPATGVTLVLSGFIALGLLGYSYWKYRVKGDPVPP
ncbi:PGPGW domain-containing protein [Nocardioides sp. URHA0020]|uniref:PGPGW domain-containing protein n=1 Tax=Nocardioides sp. URHA0020 TaxID=1380392 RepID=UPI000566155D|nr:PGPGW domain-containing protein [Nocardioides sp. URHA0020]